MPAPPPFPVPVLAAEGEATPEGFRRVVDRDRRVGFVIDWACAAGTNGRSPAEGADVSLRGGHVIIDPSDGMIRDVDNGKKEGMDRWGRKVQDGAITIPFWEGKEEKFWAQWSACDPLPLPTTPTSACAVVENLEHWMAPGNKCHDWHRDGDQIICVVDSTIRPICDKDHMDNWVKECGQRTHDPDYRWRRNAFNWKVTGAIDMGPNCPTNPDEECENAAQRVIIGDPGADVVVEVCIPPGARTPDGCLITPKGGTGCDTRRFKLPE